MHFRSLLLPAVALAAAACGSPAAPPRTVPGEEGLTEGQRSLYLRALREVASGDEAGAERALAPLLEVRPIHVPSHLLHQDIARRARGEGATKEEYEAILAETGGGDADAGMLRARAAGGTLEERIAGYQAAAVRDPRAPWPRIALAAAREELARGFQRRAEERARLGFADEARKLREDAKSSADRARAEAEKAAELAPRLAPARAALANSLATAAQLVAADDRERRALYARALAAFGEALRLDPGDPRILLGRAMLLRDAKGRADAQPDFDAAAAAAPRDPAILSARARNLDELGVVVRAVEAWEQAAAASPKDPDVAVDLGSAYARASRWSDALLLFRRADAFYASGGGPRWRARCGLATALAQMGLDAGDAGLLAEALVQLKAYREEGGMDLAWAARMAELLGEEPVAPPAPPPSPPPAESGAE